MKTLLLAITLSFFFIQNIFAQDITIEEGSEAKICGKIIRVEGIWKDNGRIKADISTLAQKNSKPMIGGYKIDDELDIKSSCKYYIKIIQKFGLRSDKGYVTLTDKLDPTDYLDMGLSSVSLNGKFNIGNKEWTVTRISNDDADFEIKSRKEESKTVTLKKNDLIWKGFELYKISDLVNTSTDALRPYWEVKFEEVKDYSYLNPNTSVIPGEDINVPKGIDSPTMLIIRKMKYYPKQKFIQAEHDATPMKYWVLKVFLYQTGIGRPMIEINFLGVKSMQEYEGYKSFDTEAEVMEFAKANNVSDIVLEEAK